MDEINEKADLIDIWRVRHPDEKKFTWRQRKPDIHSRIDCIYISDTMQYNVSQCDIVPGIRSDHSAVTLTIKPASISKKEQVSGSLTIVD